MGPRRSCGHGRHIYQFGKITIQVEGLESGTCENVRFSIGRRAVGYTIRLPLSEMTIQDIKEACAVTKEHISVSKDENTAVIQAETLEGLFTIGSRLAKLIDDFVLGDVLDEENKRKVWDELSIYGRSK